MRTWRVLFWIELDSIDRGTAEKEAKILLKKKKLEATIYSVEEG